METVRLNIGDCAAVDVLVGREREWLGFGAIEASGRVLRDASHPIGLRIDTPEGILYTRYILDDISTTTGQTARVRLRALGLPWGRQELLDEYQQSMVTPELNDPVADTVVVVFEPVTESIGGRDWQGFSWSVRFESGARRIHRILVRGSWELGGTIEGSTVLSQGQCNMPVYRGGRDALFTTTCLKTLDQYGSPQGVSYQLAPRGGLIQAFDFQHDAHGALLAYWPELRSVSSLLESPPGSTRLNFFDEHRFALSGSAATAAQRVLFAPGAFREHEARDLWWHAYEHVYGGLRERYGIHASVVRPEMGVEYYQTHLDGERLKVRILDRETDAAGMLDLTADHLLPKLAAQGIRRLFPIDAHETDVTVLGMARKLDNGIHGDLVCASVCASHRYFPSEFWGGISAWRRLADRARALGMEIGCWFSPHFSPRAEIFKEHPEWLLRGPDSLHWGGGYRSAIVTADWNTGVYDWVLGDMRRWVEEGGLDYVFVDSWANMGLLQSNYAAGMRTNWEPLARLLSEIQALGVKTYSFEGISPFGISRIGCTDRRGDLLEAQSGIVGQNDFAWWRGQEDMATNICFHLHPRKRPDQEVREVQFRLMANRAYAMLPTSGMYDMPDWWIALNHAYEQALPHMRTRRLLPDDAGVEWSDGAVTITWAFKPFTLAPGPGRAIAQLQGPACRELGGETARTAPWSVYRIS